MLLHSVLNIGASIIYNVLGWESLQEHCMQAPQERTWVCILQGFLIGFGAGAIIGAIVGGTISGITYTQGIEWTSSTSHAGQRMIERGIKKNL